ncbi:hypothetical protein Pelo_7895 [Pelomyxa schiedti]|nr:hypothetical protein Pelo_7895 [Pelomyxa schiedti]
MPPTATPKPSDPNIVLEGCDFFEYKKPDKPIPLSKEEKARRKEVFSTFISLETVLRRLLNSLESVLEKLSPQASKCKMQMKEFQVQVTIEMTKYKGWANNSLYKCARAVAMVKYLNFKLREEIVLEQMSILGQKMGDVRYVAKLNKAGTPFVVHPKIFRDTQFLLSTPAIEHKKKVLTKIAKQKTALLKCLKQKGRLHALLQLAVVNPEIPCFHAYNPKHQAKFDCWLRDSRTESGKQVHHFCNTIASNSVDIGPEDIVQFIENFSLKIKTQYHVQDGDADKLRLMIHRSLFPPVFQDVTKRANQDFQKKDIEFLNHIDKLRAMKPHPFELEPAFACDDLPFHTVPADMISCVERAVTSIFRVAHSVTNKFVCGHLHYTVSGKICIDQKLVI